LDLIAYDKVIRNLLHKSCVRAPDKTPKQIVQII